MAEVINPQNSVDTDTYEMADLADKGVVEEGLNNLEDTVVNGHIGFSEDYNEMPDWALKNARNVLVNGKVTARGGVLENAFNTVIDGGVFHTGSVGNDAENVRVLGDLENTSNVFPKAKNVRIHGELDNAGDVFTAAEDSHIIGDVDGSDILTGAVDSSIEGDVKGVNHILDGAENSRIDGDARALTIMRDAENSIIYGDIKARDHLLPKAQNSIVVGETVEAGKNIGRDSENSMIIAGEVEADSIDDNLQLITADEDLRGPTYQGDLEELFGFVEDKIESLPKMLGVFQLDSNYEGFETFQRDIEELEDLYTEQLSKTFRELKEVEDYVDLQLPDSNSERAEFLESGEQAFIETFQNSWDIEAELAEKVESSDSRNYLAKILGNTADNKIPEAPEDGFEQWFLETFYTAEEPAEDHLLEMEDGSFDFEVEKNLGNLEIESDIDEDHQEDLYNQGIELLDELMEGERRYELDEEEIEDIDELREIENELEEKHDELEELRSNIDSGEDYQRLSGELDNIEEDIEELENQKIQSYIEYQAESLDIDLENPERGNLGTLLNQVKQHALTERHPTWEKARYLFEELEAEPDDITANEVRISYWDKTGMMPSSSEYQCCAFEGGVKSRELPYWLADPNTQFLEIETGEKKGMAVTRVAEGEDGEYLVVDSVESAYSNIFRNDDVVSEVSNAINDFAETVDTELEGVVYNKDPYNSSAQQFIENLDESSYDNQNLSLSQNRENVYSEVEFEDLDGYVKRL